MYNGADDKYKILIQPLMNQCMSDPRSVRKFSSWSREQKSDSVVFLVYNSLFAFSSF